MNGQFLRVYSEDGFILRPIVVDLFVLSIFVLVIVGRESSRTTLDLVGREWGGKIFHFRFIIRSAGGGF